MTSPPEHNPFRDRLVSDHQDWLSVFDCRHLNNGEKLLAADYEAAVIEAGIRRFLTSCGAQVSPNADLTGTKRQADFLCQVTDGRFYVEVKSISIAKAS